MNMEIPRRQFPESALATAAPLALARKGFAEAGGPPATRVAPAVARRAGRSLKTNPAGGRMLDATEAAGLWTRDYAAGWQPTF